MYDLLDVPIGTELVMSVLSCCSLEFDVAIEIEMRLENRTMK
jgi:hypothetical protein